MDTIETPRMMGMTGALKEIRAFIDSRNASKTIILNASATGSDRKVLKCKDCDTFRVKICKRPNDMWEITESIEDHGKCGEDGLIQPCMGSRRPSSKDVAADGGFEALMSSRTFSEQRMSIGSIAATMGEQLPTAHRPTRDVVKKAVQANKKRNQVDQLQAINHLVDISEMSSFLSSVKALNPEFHFKINDINGIFENVLVVMPYAAAVMACSYKFIGIDGGHGKEVIVGTDEEVLRTVHIISLTTRSPNNKMSLLAFVICYSENSADIKALIDFSASHGIIFNRPDLTLFSDRGTALLAVAELALALTFKYLCCKHLERNLRANGYTNIIPQFKVGQLYDNQYVYIINHVFAFSYIAY